LQIFQHNWENIGEMSEIADASKQIHDPDVCLAFGAYVRAARNALSLSQTALAEMLGVHRTTLVRLEKGSPPLKRGLCVSAVAVLTKAGVSCNGLSTDKRYAQEQDQTLIVEFKFSSLQKAQRAMEDGLSDSELPAILLGADFVAPLEAKPLRRK
jgi:DNA-binding XRE family transcriptional regulator